MKHKLLGAALLLLMTSGAAMAQAVEPNSTVSKEKVACVSLDHAKRLVDFYSTPDAPNFRIYLFGLTASGNCVWWQKGDKIIVSPKDYGGDIISARQAKCPAHEGDDEGADQHCSLYLFFDRCALEGSDADVKHCPSY
jgi:hypothetical protein